MFGRFPARSGRSTNSNASTVGNRGRKQRALLLAKCYALPVFIAVMGLGLSFSSYARLRDGERRRLEEYFRQVATGHAEALKKSLQGSVLVVESLAAFYAGSEQVEPEEFRQFTQLLLDRHPYIAALIWIPFIRDDQRASLEAAGKRQFGEGFQITEQPPQGRRTRAGRRDHYFPIRYLEPVEGKERVLGFDFASDPMRLAAMTRALETGRAAATDRIAPRGKDNQYAFFILQPVYKPGAPIESAEQRRQALAGFVGGAFHAGDLVVGSLTDLSAGMVDVSLHDLSAPVGARLMYPRIPAAGKPSDEHSSSGRQALVELQVTSSLALAGRNWSIVCRPGPAFAASVDEDSFPYSVGMLVAALLMTAMATAYLVQVGRSVVRRERLVAEVLTINERLGAEVAERKQAEEALRGSEAKFRAIYENAGGAIFMADAETGELLDCNQQAEQLIGRGRDEIIGMHQSKLHPPGEAEKYRDKFLAHVDKGHDVDYEGEVQHADGRRIPVLIAAQAFHLSGRHVIAGVFLDISRRREAERKLQQTNDRLKNLAGQDPLTGLPNRRRLLAQLDHELERAHRYGGDLAVVMLDADHLKPVNDIYGHELGDKALMAVADALCCQTRKTDLVARYGGDEFAILMPNTPAEVAVETVERIRTTIAEHSISDLKRALTITVSAGLCMARKNDGRGAANLLKLSDRALYAAKRSGRNCTRMWQDVQDAQPSTDQAGDGEQTVELRKQVADLMHQAKNVSVQGIWSLIQALEARDVYTRSHSENVTRYAVGIAQALGQGPRSIEIIRRAAMVHDIGKIGLPDTILHKSGALTEDQRAKVQTHALAGVRILQEMRLMELEIPIVRCHHERWDGMGYPEGIAGPAIPLGARIISVADTLDAITSDRIYRKSRDLQTALRIIDDESGRQFDPDIVCAFQQWVACISDQLGVGNALTTQQLLDSQASATALSADVMAV